MQVHLQHHTYTRRADVGQNRWWQPATSHRAPAHKRPARGKPALSLVGDAASKGATRKRPAQPRLGLLAEEGAEGASEGAGAGEGASWELPQACLDPDMASPAHQRRRSLTGMQPEPRPCLLLHGSNFRC